MIENYKIVCNTAAGRRRYMQYLIPQVISCDVVDRYDIWVNTTDKQDIEFFKILATKYSKISLVYQPDGVVNGIASINAFYKSCVEEDVIYFKLDDDIVWLEPGLIEKMVRFRIDNPDYFLVSPLVINNAISTYLLQVSGKLSLDRYYRSNTMCDTLWRSGEFAAQLHEHFLNNYLKTAKYEQLHCGTHPVAMCRFSINAILWFGREMQKFGGIVPGDDEEWLSSIKPTELGMSNCFNGDAIVSHFAFFTQRKMLDKRIILQKYGELLHREWNKDVKMKSINDEVQSVLEYVEQNKELILNQSNIYKLIPSNKKTLKSLIGDLRIPVITFKSIRRLKLYFCSFKSDSQYIK